MAKCHATAAHEQCVPDLAEVRAARMEPDGQVSVIKRDEGGKQGKREREGF